MIPEVKEGRLIGLLAAEQVNYNRITVNQQTIVLQISVVQENSYEISSKLLQFCLLHSLLEHGVDSRPTD